MVPFYDDAPDILLGAFFFSRESLRLYATLVFVQRPSLAKEQTMGEYWWQGGRG